MRLSRVQRWVFAAAAMVAPLLAAETLTIATYNVENYGPANRHLEDGFHPNYPKPEAEKSALRKVIAAIGADVLVIEEMGPQPYLEELRRDLKRDGCDYPFWAMAAAADADRHVAILSRRQLHDTATVDLNYEYFGGIEHVKRGLLVSKIATSAGDLTVFGVHLKSRLTQRRDDPDSNLRRLGEAIAVRDAILRLFPDPAHAQFAIVGDFNDTKASKPLARLLHRGDTEIVTLLPARDSHGESWTYRYGRDETYSRIDFVLVSPGLRANVPEGFAHIYDGESAAIASDHRPVWLRLEFGAK